MLHTHFTSCGCLEAAFRLQEGAWLLKVCVLPALKNGLLFTLEPALE